MSDIDHDQFIPNTHISNTLQDARAIVSGSKLPNNHIISLQHPTRPHTPAHILKRQTTLFNNNNHSSNDYIIPIRHNGITSSTSSDTLNNHQPIYQPTNLQTQARSQSSKENTKQHVNHTFESHRNSINAPIKAITQLCSTQQPSSVYDNNNNVSAWSTEPTNDDWLHTDSIIRPSSRISIQRPESSKSTNTRPRSAKYGTSTRNYNNTINSDVIKQSMAVQLQAKYDKIENDSNVIVHNHITQQLQTTITGDTDSNQLNASIQNSMADSISLLDINNDNIHAAAQHTADDQVEPGDHVSHHANIDIDVQSSTLYGTELQSPVLISSSSSLVRPDQLFTQFVTVTRSLDVTNHEQISFISSNAIILIQQQYTGLSSDHQLLLLQSILQLPRHREFKSVMTTCCCKLLELSKDNLNDTLLLQCADSITSVLLHCNTQQSTNLLGTLYNVTVDMNNVLQLNIDSLMPSMHQLLRKISTMDPVNISLITAITSLLRNLTSIEYEHCQILFEPCCSVLYHLLHSHINNGDILLNVIRVLSKLSYNEWCQQSMINSDNNITQLLLTLLSIHHTKLPLCVRVCYILGDCTMYNDTIRLLVSDCSMTSSLTNLAVTGLYVVLDLLQRTYERDRKLRALPCDTDTPELQSKHESMISDNNELLIKLIRLLANLSINRSVGPTIVDDIRSDVLIRVMIHHSVETNEELILNTVSAIANLTFYAYSDSHVDGHTILHNDSTVLMNRLLPLLFHHNTDVLSETLRCLGNLSRNESIRKQLHDTRSDEAIILLLSHNDINILHNSCGVLLNISGDNLGQQLLLLNDNDRLIQLVEIIQRQTQLIAAERDYTLCSTICKIILNSVHHDNHLSPDMSSLVNTSISILLGVLSNDSTVDDIAAELRTLCNMILQL